MVDDELAALNADMRLADAGLRRAGVPGGLRTYIKTRALRSGRRLTGRFRSNRDPRWTLDPEDPQFGTEVDCKRILLRLYAMMLEFSNAPAVDDDTRLLLEGYLGKPIEPGTYRDALTAQPLDYMDLAGEGAAPVHGRSRFHIGHENPTIAPKHVPANVSWREERSNLIQGNQTLREARSWLLIVLGRYLGLGEVHIEPEELPPPDEGA